MHVHEAISTRGHGPWTRTFGVQFEWQGHFIRTLVELHASQVAGAAPNPRAGPLP